MWNRNQSFILSFMFFVALNCTSIENFSFSGTKVIWLSLMFLGSLNPYLSIQALVASQTLATPIDFPFTHTQTFLLIWFVVNLVRLRSINPRTAIIALAPFLGVVLVVSFMKGSFSGLVFSVSVIAVVYLAYICYRMAASDIAVLSNVILGSFMAAMPFLMSFLSLNYYRDARQLAIMTAERGGVQRFSAGLGDFNYIGSCILVGFAITVTIVAYHLLFIPIKISLSQKVIFVGIMLAAPFSVFATLSRACIVGLFFTLFILIGFLIRERLFNSRWVKTFIIFSVCCFSAYFLFKDFWSNYLNVILQLNFKGYGYETSRYSLAMPHILAMLDHPILGGEVEAIRGVKFAAHNTFIEMGSTYGLFGGLAFLHCTIIRPMRNLKSLTNHKNIPFYVSYIICLYSMFWLSLGGWKIFWILWTILIVKSERIKIKRGDFSPLPGAVKPVSRISYSTRDLTE